MLDRNTLMYTIDYIQRRRSLINQWEFCCTSLEWVGNGFSDLILQRSQNIQRPFVIIFIFGSLQSIECARVACAVSLQELKGLMNDDDLMMAMQWHACIWVDDVMMVSVSKWSMIRCQGGMQGLGICLFVLILDKALPCQGQDLNKGIMVISRPAHSLTQQALAANPLKSLQFRGTFLWWRGGESENCNHARHSCPLLSVASHFFFTVLDNKSYQE